MSVFDTNVIILESKKAEFAAQFITSMYSNNEYIKEAKIDARRFGMDLEDILARNAILQTDRLLKGLMQK